ncbi:hypothetical protein OHJ16_12260 [Actinomyces israelii]|uniref:Uncharacterized protein n=1 Tax=Actinomyces israelii TaxID=1659 RepID=A0ABT4IBT0_9ACTO|nr:hypothetical protein [Actinomyces israelii]MCZ0858814.1 hypothetical protein [Actinomyces israelii]
MAENFGVKSAEDLFDSDRELIYRGLFGVDFDSARAVLGVNLEYSIKIRCGDGGEDSEKSYNAVTIRLECGRVSEVSSRAAQGLNSDAALMREASDAGCRIYVRQSGLRLTIACESIDIVGCSPHWLE